MANDEQVARRETVFARHSVPLRIAAILLPAISASVVSADGDRLPLFPEYDEVATGSLPRSFPPASTLEMPEEQRRLLQTVARARALFVAAKNPEEKRRARRERSRDLCMGLPDASAVEWLGEIEDVSVTRDLRGIVRIRLGDGIVVRTWTTGASDLNDRTLMGLSDPLFAEAMALRKGDKVVFSGAFPRDSDDCLREASLTVHGSLTRPEFIIRFSRIERTPGR